MIDDIIDDIKNSLIEAVIGVATSTIIICFFSLVLSFYIGFVADILLFIFGLVLSLVSILEDLKAFFEGFYIVAFIGLLIDLIFLFY